MSLLVNFILIGLFVRKRRPCRLAWTDAGITRRLATLSWALAYLLRNGGLGGNVEPPITVEDIFPSGVNHAERQDIQRIHDLIGNWLDFWSDRRPAITLENAMLSLIVRLIEAKRGWIAEQSSAFPFEQCLGGIANEEFEAYWLELHSASGPLPDKYQALF